MVSSATTFLGENVENNDQLVAKITNVKKKIEGKRTQFENMKVKIDKLTSLNRKLANGYELSLKVVVDVSKLLQNYTKMFDDIEHMLGSLDTDLGSQQLDIKYISELTKKSIEKIKTDFNSQYPTIIDALEKDGNKENVASARKLKVIVQEISDDATKIEEQMKNQGASTASAVQTTDKNNSWFGGGRGRKRTTPSLRGGRKNTSVKSTNGGKGRVSRKNI